MRVIASRSGDSTGFIDDPVAHCLTGRRACPPEDVGGPWGYTEVLDALNGTVEPDNAEWRRDLAASLERIGDIELSGGDVAGALAAQQEAIEIVRALVRRDPDNTLWQRDLALSLSNIGALQLRAGERLGYDNCAPDESLLITQIRRRLDQSDARFLAA